MTRAPRRLLLVDDDAPTRELLREVGEAAGFTVQVADSGTSALQALAQGTPDVVLLDVMMPGMDGFEVLQALRGQAQTREIPVVLLSASAEMNGKIRGMELGADDFITKPFKIDELTIRLRAAVDASQYRRRMADADGPKARQRALDPSTRAGTYAQLRVVLENEFGRAQRFQRPLAVLRIGLQGFTSVRGTLGIDECEQLMVALAERMRASLRGADRLFRMESDEFVVILPETEMGGAQKTAERLGGLVHREGEKRGSAPLQLDVRIGGAAFPNLAVQTSEDLLRLANQKFVEQTLQTQTQKEPVGSR